MKKLALAFFVALVTLCLIGCDNGSDGGDGGGYGSNPPTTGKFILTDAESYNGKYAYVIGSVPEGFLYGRAGDRYEPEGIKIVDGKVELPMYFMDSKLMLSGYTGNHTVVDGFFSVHIMEGANANLYLNDWKFIEWDTVTFVNGSVTKSVLDGIVYY